VPVRIFRDQVVRQPFNIMDYFAIFPCRQGAGAAVHVRLLWVIGPRRPRPMSRPVFTVLKRPY
jgi:hypothetical protein